MSRRRMPKRSQLWAERSRQCRALTDHCVCCLRGGDDVRLVAHHLRYPTGGRGNGEHPEDVVVICADCHDEIHRRKLGGPKGFLRFRDTVRALVPLPEPVEL